MVQKQCRVKTSLRTIYKYSILEPEKQERKCRGGCSGGHGKKKQKDGKGFVYSD